jgi:hypothetical protein
MRNTIAAFTILVLFSGSTAKRRAPVGYDELKRAVNAKRDVIRTAYLASDSAAKDSIVKAATTYVFQTITTDIFSYWYGTPWDFNGQTQVPGQGTIACGYFVTTVLRDAGLNIPRVRWACVASEEAIMKMTTDIKRFSNRPVNEVITSLKSRGDGLYVVGLDRHFWFIYVKGDTLKFVHSNYYEPAIGVMAQDLDTENPLNASQYRVIGRILDHRMVKNWILNAKYE